MKNDDFLFSGWISPSGEWHPCPLHRMEMLAAELGAPLGYELELLGPIETLTSHGWIFLSQDGSCLLQKEFEELGVQTPLTVESDRAAQAYSLLALFLSALPWGAPMASYREHLKRVIESFAPVGSPVPFLLKREEQAERACCFLKAGTVHTHVCLKAQLPDRQWIYVEQSLYDEAPQVMKEQPLYWYYRLLRGDFSEKTPPVWIEEPSPSVVLKVIWSSDEDASQTSFEAFVQSVERIFSILPIGEWSIEVLGATVEDLLPWLQDDHWYVESAKLSSLFVEEHFFFEGIQVVLRPPHF